MTGKSYSNQAFNVDVNQKRCHVPQALQSHEQPRTRATPEDLVRCAKPITQATAKAVAAGNSGKQDDIIVAANMGRKAISDMLTTCKVGDSIVDNVDIIFVTS